METIRHEISKELMPPIQRVSKSNRQSIINGEVITFKEGDEIDASVTHILLKGEHPNTEYSYSIDLRINGALIRVERSVMHTFELLNELIEL